MLAALIGGILVLPSNATQAPTCQEQRLENTTLQCGALLRTTVTTH